MQVKQEKQQNYLISYLLQCGIPNNNIIEAFNKIDFKHLNQDFNIENYLDNHIKLEDRYIINPLLLARLLNILDPQKNDIILEIFPTNFYSTFILAEIASHITALETKSNFINNVKNSYYYKKSGNKINIKNKIPKGIKFDKIIIYGAINNLDKNLLMHLDNCGVLVYIFYDNQESYSLNSLAKVKIVRKKNNVITEKTVFTTQIFSLNNEIKYVYS